MIRRCVHDKKALDILAACHNGTHRDIIVAKSHQPKELPVPNLQEKVIAQHYFGVIIPAMDIPDLNIPNDNAEFSELGQA
ncbi:hypothetical protein Tco_0989591 [Tanacetum coccineum]|uniref:Uncharacterized protein n=1 Tax=Tanacetum coccineum TaxID=301880 RepID=A0ABQ5EVL0_9ASTR